MKNETKRIFISDLPETVTQDEINNNFSKYGEVSSIEIKERKELGPKNHSLFYAYINLLTDDKGINQCFRELSNIKWSGQYIQLQMAKESFLDRLRREREENVKISPSFVSNGEKGTKTPEVKQNGMNYSRTYNIIEKKSEKSPIKATKKYKSSSESDSESSDSEITLGNSLQPDKNTIKIHDIKLDSEQLEPEEKLDIIIKTNKGKVIDKNGLKIPSVGKEPIIKITKIKTKPVDSEANSKRLKSISDMKKSYIAQKSLIKNALSYGNSKPNKKVVFDDDNEEDISSLPVQKNPLFTDNKSDDDSDFEGNFELKEQFEGISGQKLLELQSKYKNDKRFALDKRFINCETNEDERMETDETCEENLEAEKKAELKILEQVLGKKISSPSKIKKESHNKEKPMLRFDPSQPEHSKLEMAVTGTEVKKGKNKKLKNEVQEENQQEPEVSKEVFYKVTNNLKETFEEKEQFSLLSMFGKEGNKEKSSLPEGKEKEIKRNSLGKSQNPFKYDSSEDEDDAEDIPHKNEMGNTSQSKPPEPTTRSTPAVFWTEPFFFKPDDYRLQEGFDFVEKIKTENREFQKVRRDLKGIVKAKLRNNERKNKMFKKKLGGSKRRKHIRMKKALKR